MRAEVTIATAGGGARKLRISDTSALVTESMAAAARARGMTAEQQSELLVVIAMASQTNALATALQVEVDDVFKE